MVGDPEIDEGRQHVLVGQIGIETDFVRRLHVAHAKVPRVARLVLADFLQHAPGLVISARALGNEKTRERAVALPDFAQVLGDFGGVLLAAQHPVAQKGAPGGPGLSGSRNTGCRPSAATRVRRSSR